MESSLNQFTPLLAFTFIGLFTTTFLLLMAFIMDKTNGLFLARSLKDFKKDQKKTEFEKERQVGKKLSAWIFKFIPPFFIVFLVLFLVLSLF